MSVEAAGITTYSAFGIQSPKEFILPALGPKPEIRNRIPGATEKRAEALLAAYEVLVVARTFPSPHD